MTSQKYISIIFNTKIVAKIIFLMFISFPVGETNFRIWNKKSKKNINPGEVDFLIPDLNFWSSTHERYDKSAALAFLFKKYNF